MEQPSDHFFDREFREKMENLEAQPSELPWIGVSAALDQMRKEHRRKRFIYLSSLAAFLLIVFALYFSSISSGHLQANSERLKAAGNLPDFFIPSTSGKNETLLSSPARQPRLSEEAQRKNGQTGFAKKERPLHNRSIVNSFTQRRNHINSAFEKELLFLNEEGALATLTINRLSNREPEGPAVDRKEIILPEWERYSYHTLRIGFTGQIQNTGLTSPAIDQHFISSSGSHRIPKIRMAYGLSAAYDFNNVFGLEVDLLISSSEGQNFKSGKNKSDLSSNYIRIPVMVKYRMLKAGSIKGRAHAWVVKGGVQYGRLNWVNLDAFPEYIDPTQFRSNEIGLIGDLGYERYLTQHHILNAGLRYSYNSPPAGQEEKVRAHALAFYLQIHYALQKRKK